MTDDDPTEVPVATAPGESEIAAMCATFANALGVDDTSEDLDRA